MIPKIRKVEPQKSMSEEEFDKWHKDRFVE